MLMWNDDVAELDRDVLPPEQARETNHLARAEFCEGRFPRAP
jgi:hypothetical protein